MKRFSKIFCVALIAIIFVSNLYILKAKADDPPAYQRYKATGTDVTNAIKTANELYPQCKDENSSINNSGIVIDELSLDCTIQNLCPRYCYSKSASYILAVYKKLTGSTPETDKKFNPTIQGISEYITAGLGSSTSTSTETSNFANAYNDFITNIPDNSNYVEGVNNLSKALGALGNTDKANIGTGALDARADATVIAFQNEGESTNDVCANGFSFWKISTWLPTFNCWTVSLISKVIEWGVKLMSLFIEPSFWGGISTNPAVAAGFGASVKLVNIVFSVVLAAMAIGTILNLKSYKINDLITKFIIVALLINFTLVIAGSIIDLANYLSLYFLNLTAHSANGSIVSAWMSIFSGVANYSSAASTTGVLLITLLINILLLVAMTWAFGSIIFSLLKRGFMLIVLLILSPFAVITYLLPGKGMGQWWGKWKAAFLKYTFYGVYVTAGIYLGTIMLQSLCINLNTDSLAANSEMSFMSGLIVPIMAAGFLIFIVLLADELAGGSAKAAAEGASKLALGLAGGAALAGAMQAKNAVTTSEWYGKTAGALSTTKGLGWMGNAGLKARETSLAYRDKQGSTVDADVNRRDIETNKARLKAIATSTDPKLAREKVAIAKQLIAQKKMDKDSTKLLEDNADTIANDNNRRTGWIPALLKKSLKDSMPSLFIRYDVEKDTGVSEKEVTDIMANKNNLDENGNVDIVKAAHALVVANPKLGLDPGNVGLALRKYLDDRAKIGIQFARNAANANEEMLVNAIIDKNEIVQAEIMKRLAENPATMKSVMDQISESGLSTSKKKEVIAAFQKYLDDHGSQYTEKQLHYIDENVSRLSTDTARSRKANKTPVNEALETAFEENVVRTEEIKIEGNIAKQKQMRGDRIKTIQDIKKSQEITRDRESLEKEIEAARIKRFTAQDEQSAKQHLEELQKKWNDTYGPNHK